MRSISLLYSKCRGFWQLSVCLLMLATGIYSIALGQTEGSGLLEKEYPFINKELNDLNNSLWGLRHFYRQLELLESGEKRTVSIVHIGDSHLQADIFSGSLREALHRRFGAAGRGLVFPYKVARTNSPGDIKSSSNISWEAKRNIYTKRPLPIGVSGITLRTFEENFVLRLSIASKTAGIDYSFNKVTVFSDKGPQNYDILLSELSNGTGSTTLSSNSEQVYHHILAGESLSLISQKYGVTIDALRSLNGISGDLIFAGQRLKIPKKRSNNISVGKKYFRDLAAIDHTDISKPFSSTVTLQKPTNSIYLRGKKQSPEQRQAIIYGISLENDTQEGILYNMIGVNGAQFFHYNASEHFYDQLEDLKPDLVIISLGTNETVGKYFNSSRFGSQVDQMIKLLQNHLPNTDILLTTPPDAYRYRKFKNPHPGTAATIISEYADEHNLGCWNFYEVMGGYSSISSWYTHGLAQADKLHLTRSGYKLQGRLLYEAIMKAYGRYLTNGSR